MCSFVVFSNKRVKMVSNWFSHLVYCINTVNKCAERGSFGLKFQCQDCLQSIHSQTYCIQFHNKGILQWKSLPDLWALYKRVMYYFMYYKKYYVLKLSGDFYHPAPLIYNILDWFLCSLLVQSYDKDYRDFDDNCFGLFCNHFCWMRMKINSL